MKPKVKELHRCVSCDNKTTGQKILFGICIACQDFILKSRASDYHTEQEKLMRPEYDKLGDLRDSIKEEIKNLKVEKQAIELVKLIKEIL